MKRSTERSRHIDVSLIEANLALSPVERLRKQEQMASDIGVLQAAVRKKRMGEKGGAGVSRKTVTGRR